MPRYPVKEPLNHDQKDYLPGTEVELTEEQAASLARVGVIGEMIAESGNKLNVAQTVELVKAAQVEELDKLAEGETRKGVIDAIAARRAELAQG